MKQRDWRFDALRVLMSFLVVMLHVSAYGCVSMYNSRIPILYNALGRVGVPIFYMTAGAMALGRKEAWTKTYDRGLRRIVIPFAVAAVFFACYRWYWGRESIVAILRAIPTVSPYYHLSFMYTMIELYLVLPLLMAAWPSMRLRYKLLIAVLVLCLDMPQVRQVVSIRVIGNHVIGYAMMGAALRDLIKDSTAKWLKPAWWKAAIMFSGWIVLTYVLTHKVWTDSLQIGQLNESAWTYQSLLVVLPAVVLYLGVMLMPITAISPKVARGLAYLNALTLTVYIIHPAVLDVFFAGRINVAGKQLILSWNTWSPIIWIPMLSLIIYLISAIIAGGLSWMKRGVISMTGLIGKRS